MAVFHRPGARVLLASLLLASLGACGSEGPEGGKLTSDLVMSSGRLVKPSDPWDKALAKLVSKLGQPTRIEGKKHLWAVVEGDSCTYFEVEKSDDMVSSVMVPMRVDKDGPPMNYSRCFEIVGKKPPTP